jgi:hypothetical protein
MHKGKESEKLEQSDNMFPCPFGCGGTFTSTKFANQHAVHRSCEKAEGKSETERKNMLADLKAQVVKPPTKFKARDKINCPCGSSFSKNQGKLHRTREVHKEWARATKASDLSAVVQDHLDNFARSMLKELLCGAHKQAKVEAVKLTNFERTEVPIQLLDGYSKTKGHPIKTVIDAFTQMNGDVGKFKEYADGGKINLWSQWEDSVVQAGPRSPDYPKLQASPKEIEERKAFLDSGKAAILRRKLLEAYNAVSRSVLVEGVEPVEDIIVPRKRPAPEIPAVGHGRSRDIELPADEYMLLDLPPGMSEQDFQEKYVCAGLRRNDGKRKVKSVNRIPFLRHVMPKHTILPETPVWTQFWEWKKTHPEKEWIEVDNIMGAIVRAVDGEEYEYVEDEEEDYRRGTLEMVLDDARVQRQREKEYRQLRGFLPRGRNYKKAWYNKGLNLELQCRIEKQEKKARKRKKKK